ncbi:MAG: phosphoribosyltransferase [Candidatus Thorarchaeota archaeon]
MPWPYKDREHAGKILAEKLRGLPFNNDTLVLAVPNGGVAVALPIADSLEATVDVIIVRKLQIPYNPEAGFGALTSLGTLILNEDLVARLGLSQEDIDSVHMRTENQIQARKEAYDGLAGIHFPDRKDVILVDDGLASGYTMLAAISSVKESQPASITVAVPTASASAVQRVTGVVDRLVCPNVGSGYVFAVADAYENWYDVPDTEVVEALRTHRARSYL